MIEKAWVLFRPPSMEVIAGKRSASVIRTSGVAAGSYDVGFMDDLVNPSAVAHVAFGGVSIASAYLRHAKVENVDVRTVRVRVRGFTGTLEDPPELSVFVETDRDDSIGA